MFGPGRRGTVLCVMSLLVVLALPSSVAAALFDENVMRNHGYMRQYVSMNLQDVPETIDDDRYNLNMVRTQVLLESDLDLTGWVDVHSRLRAAREYETEYLANLQDPSELSNTPTNGAADLTERYETFLGENDLEVRELYLDLSLTRSTSLRVGKQMVAWGKGSFERALDLVTGFDGTWAPVVTDEQERRKSLLMGLLTVEYPEYSGALEAFYQPGYDDLEDIGNSSDNFGGRNTANGLRGLDTTSPLTVAPGTSILFNHPINGEAEASEVEAEKFGLRWRATALNNRIEYSLAYLRTHQKSAVDQHAADPYRSDTTTVGCETPTLFDDGIIAGETGGACLESGQFRERVYPIVDVYGASFNHYNGWLNTVVRGEVAYLKDRVFEQAPEANQAAVFAGFPTPANRTALNQFLGTSLIRDQITKDEYRLMLGFDRTAYFTTYLLGSDRPGGLTVEFFDFWIDDYESDEFLRDTTHTLERDGSIAAGTGTGAVVGGGLNEHSLEAVTSLSWSYASGYYDVGLTGLFDLSYGGNYALLPSLQVNPTTHWIIKTTGVFVLEDNPDGTQATSFGAQSNGDRITTQVTYQF